MVKVKVSENLRKGTYPKLMEHGELGIIVWMLEGDNDKGIGVVFAIGDGIASLEIGQYKDWNIDQFVDCPASVTIENV